MNTLQKSEREIKALRESGPVSEELKSTIRLLSQMNPSLAQEDADWLDEVYERPSLAFQ